MMNKTQISRLIICLVIVGMQFAVPSRVSACSCAGRDTPAEGFRRHYLVFTGKVVSITPTEIRFVEAILTALRDVQIYPRFVYRYYSGEQAIAFDVSTSWKGSSSQRIILYDNRCNSVFFVGSDYLVYGSKDLASGRFYSNMCSRTNEIAYVSEDLAYLNTLPSLPLKPAPPDLTLLYCVSVLAVLGLGMYFIRRKRPRAD